MSANAIANGATSKADSQVAPAPIPDDRKPADLVAKAAALKAQYRALQAQINAESITNRAKKAAERIAKEAADEEAFLCRIYKVGHSAKSRKTGLAQMREALENFEKDMVPVRYSLQSMKERSDAAILAKAAESAGVNTDPDLD